MTGNPEKVEINASTLHDLREFAREQHLSAEIVLERATREGLSVLRQREFFDRRLKRAETARVADALAILDRAGNEPPRPGDELPEGYQPRT